MPCCVEYSTINPCNYLNEMFLFLQLCMWCQRGSVKCEENERKRLSLSYSFVPLEGATVVLCLSWITQGWLKLLSSFGFFYIHHLNIVQKYLCEFRLLITGPFVWSINGVKVFGWFYCLPLFTLQRFLLPQYLCWFCCASSHENGPDTTLCKTVLWVLNLC